MVMPSKLEQPARLEERTPVPSDVEPPDAPAPDALAPDAPVPALGLAPTSTNELFKLFLKAYLEA